MAEVITALAMTKRQSLTAVRHLSDRYQNSRLSVRPAGDAQTPGDNSRSATPRAAARTAVCSPSPGPVWPVRFAASDMAHKCSVARLGVPRPVPSAACFDSVLSGPARCPVHCLAVWESDMTPDPGSRGRDAVTPCDPSR